MMLYTLNVNGLIGKFQEIQNLLVTDQPHLVCLTETKLSADVDDNLISIPGYSIVRRDRNNHGGGVAIYYKTDLKVTRTDFTELTDDVLVYCHGRALETVASYKYLGVFLDSELSWRHHIDHVLRKVSRKIFALRTAGSQLTLKSRRQYYVSVIQPDLEYGSTAFSSSLSAREKARLFQASRKGICAIARASPWTPTTPLLKIFGLAPLSVRFDLKLLLLTHRCVHSIASTLLCSQYNLRTQANSTYRTTRGQTFNSLCLPLVTRRSGELTPLYTSTLLYNNLPSELRSPNISFSLFHCTIMKYLGHPVRRP